MVLNTAGSLRSRRFKRNPISAACWTTLTKVLYSGVKRTRLSAVWSDERQYFVRRTSSHYTATTYVYYSSPRTDYRLFVYRTRVPNIWG